MPDYLGSATGGSAAANQLARLGADGRLHESMGLLRKRNRVLNPGMRVSQERGSASVTVASGTPAYPVDQWVVRHGSSGLGLTAQQIASPTPGGSPNRLRLTVATGVVSPGNVTVSAPIEGSDVADLRLGSASARSVSVRLGLNAPAGTCTVGLRNAASSRFIGQAATISPAQAGTDQIFNFVFPGDTAGAWLTDTSLGLELVIALASSATVTPGAWAASGGPGVTGQTNGVAAAGSIDLFDVGLYEGATAPAFELPSIADDLRACQRYYEVFGTGIGGRASSASNINCPGGAFRVPKRSTPAISLLTPTPQIIEVDQGYRTGSGSVLNAFNPSVDGVTLISINGFSGMGTGNQVALTQSILAASARLI